jgi:DNA transformation protein and related proteins
MKKPHHVVTRAEKSGPSQVDIASVRNIGHISAQWLRAVGVRNRTELERLGAVEVYLRVVAHGFRPTRNLLYAMEAGLRDIHWMKLSPSLKRSLSRAAGYSDF